MFKKIQNIIKATLLCSIMLPNLFTQNSEESVDLSLKDDLKINVEKNELKKIKKDALRLGQAACFFTTHGKDPYFKVIYTDVDESKVIKCGYFDEESGQNKYIEKPKDLENIIPLRYLLNGFGGNYKIDTKYPGERKTLLGKTIETLLLPNCKYEGTIFIDEYKKNIPMFWILNNVEELRALSTYFLKKFTEDGFVSEKKTLLVLKIKNDPELETLDETDKEFLKTYFDIFPLTDKDVKKFFRDCREDMLDYSNLTNPKYIDETAIQGTFRNIEKFYNDFEFKNLVILVDTFVATKIIYDTISNEINNGRKKVIQKISKNPKAESIIGALMDKFLA